jgi:hypothetical protein
MKKLLDETTDDLTRSLLEAGRSHRPPATSQTKLLVALGVGSSVGLLSSKAFAWLGTSTGKLTVLGVGVLGVGVAGALYGAASPSGVPSAPSGREQVAALSPAASPAAAPQVAAPPFVPAHVADAPSNPGRDPVAGLPAVNEGPARRANAPVASESPHRTARVRKGSAVRRDDVRQPLAAQREAEDNAPHAALDAVGAGPAGAEVAQPRAPGLESELQLVDAMRGAAQRNDTQALRGLVESYRGSFPHGQLRAEVAELALRALPAAR